MNECLLELDNFDTLWLGFSGGLDSTVLLHRICQTPSLKKKLRVIHVNHGLSDSADAWARHCQRLCEQNNLPFVCERVSIDPRSNVEEQARTARHRVFKRFVTSKDCLLLAHHADDQAETLLLNLARGAGIKGLAAMPKKTLKEGMCLMRPLLDEPRSSLKAYALEHKLEWVEDESNTDCRYSRNFLRQGVLPLLQERWPGVAQTIARAANYAQESLKCLHDLAEIDAEKTLDGACLVVAPFKQLSPHRRVNMLRHWLGSQVSLLPSHALLEQVHQQLMTAQADSEVCVQWGGVCARHYKGRAYLCDADTPLQQTLLWHDFPSPLLFQGGVLTAELVDTDDSLSPSLCTQSVSCERPFKVKSRVGGERLRLNGQSKSLKKLFQAWGVPPWLRAQVPLVYQGDELIAVVGYAVADCHQGRAHSNMAVTIQYTSVD